MTCGGFPSAATRLTTRPSASSTTRRPSGRVYSSACGRTSRVTFTAASASAGTLTSASKCPAFARIAPSRRTARCSAATTSRDPVAVMITSPTAAASRIGSTRYPRSTASRARTGSTSVTMTWAPSPCAQAAMPCPHGPNPATTTARPASRMLVARSTPSSTDCPVPAVLSNIRLVVVASAATMGNASAPAAAIRRSRSTPVEVDSQPPRTFPTSSGRAASVSTRSPPSSMTRSGPGSRTRWMCSA